MENQQILNHVEFTASWDILWTRLLRHPYFEFKTISFWSNPTGKILKWQYFYIPENFIYTSALFYPKISGLSVLFSSFSNLWQISRLNAVWGLLFICNVIETMSAPVNYVPQFSNRWPATVTVRKSDNNVQRNILKGWKTYVTFFYRFHSIAHI